jgi:hypothetical protein
MNLSKIIFQISATESLCIKSSKDPKDLDYCYMAPVIYKDRNKKIVLRQDSIYNSMDILSYSLKKALNNKSSLHISIKDVGFLYNQYRAQIWGIKVKEAMSLVYEKHEKTSEWVGTAFYLWSKNNVASWMYNDKAGSIIFELTPLYPYIYCDPRKDPHYIPYQEWIKSYKPYLIRELSHETARKWLSQAEYIVNQIQMNMERWENENKK